jgi:hypothetical protein
MGELCFELTKVVQTSESVGLRAKRFDKDENLECATGVVD